MTDRSAMPSPPPLNLAYFVSPHGFGHAARAVAVMHAVAQRLPGVHWHVFTTVPPWFFGELATGPVDVHRVETDVGLVQGDAFSVDGPATVDRLQALLATLPERAAELAGLLRAARCRAVLCDISPLGIATAQAAAIPSLLVENFTWDWIYERLIEPSGTEATADIAAVAPSLKPLADALARIFAEADWRVTVTPAAGPARPRGQTAGVVARPRKRDVEAVRRELGLPQGAPVALVTMGGIGFNGLQAPLETHPDLHVILGGAAATERRGRVLHLGRDEGVYFPDLVAAVDLVVAKLGYSTLAEVVQAGTPFAYVPYMAFPENPVLAAFAEEHLASLPVSLAALTSGDWVDAIQPLLGDTRRVPVAATGADDIASRLIARLEPRLGTPEPLDPAP